MKGLYRLAALAGLLILVAACNPHPPAGTSSTPRLAATGQPAPAASRAAAGGEGERLEAFFERSWRELSLRDPEGVLADGLAGVYGLEGVELTDISDAYVQETYDLYVRVLDELYTFDRATLSPEQQVSYDVYEWYLADKVRQRPFLLNDYPATFYPVTAVHLSLIYFFTDLHPLASKQDATDYVTRLGQVGRKLEQLVDGLARREEAGVVPPRFSLEWALYDVRGLAGASAADTPFYGALAEKLEALDGVDEAEKQALLQAAEQAIEESVLPGYQALAEALSRQVSLAPTDDGLWQFDDGDEYYAYLLRHYTSTDMTPGEIHELGKQELDHIHAEMRTLFDRLGYPQDESLAQLYDRVEQDGGQVPGSRVLSTYEAIIEKAEARLDTVFAVRPQAGLVVVSSPIKGMYVSASFDGSRPGAFHAGPGTMAEPLYAMPTLAYHEAIPGHHFQIALAQESDLPDFRNSVMFLGYTEGWALYAEQLAAELGWYEDDVYGDLGRLQADAFRAARLVVDTGIHAKGWTFDQALGYFVENVGFERGDSVDPETQIARYIVWPGQATAYKIGQLKIRTLRQRAMDELGERFDLKEFHSVVLANGSMPLEVLERVVDDYIALAARGGTESAPPATPSGPTPAPADSPLPTASPAPPTDALEPASPPATQGRPELRISIVYDNTVYEPGLGSAWGFAAYLEYGEHTLLFDTGGNGGLLMSNMEKMGLDLQAVEAIVLSHIHGDHTDGLVPLLKKGIRPTVYVPAAFPDEFKDEVLSYTDLVEVHGAAEILPGLYSTGQLGMGIREQALVVETSEGLVVITGCAHPGIVKMVGAASRLVEDDIELVVGGFHLEGMQENRVMSIINNFRDMGVRQVCPTHCTGEEAIALFVREYGDGFLEGGVGRVIGVGLAGD